MKKLLTTREIQLEQLFILKDVINFLEENKLDYSIAGGTMLGAIRHNGFIPWDDDIDILMPRHDFEFFIDNYKDSDSLYLASYKNGKINLPFAKVFYKKVKISQRNYKKTDNGFLWIDIFPMDGIEEDNKKSDVLFRKINFLKKCIGLSNTKISAILREWREPKKIIVKSFMKPFVFIIPKSFFIKRINYYCKNCDYDNSKYVGNVAWALSKKEKFLKEKISPKKKVTFEDIMVNGFEEYDYYLTQLYGDYMKLPPLDKRENHEYEAWIDYEKQ